MEISRRRFLGGMAGILASGVAPAVLPSGIIMPIRKLIVKDASIVFDGEFTFPSVSNMLIFNSAHDEKTRDEVIKWLTTMHRFDSYGKELILQNCGEKHD